jgi:hypothetical protein
MTDGNGEVRIEYPKYVFEEVETGVVCLAVEHPDFVSDRPERVVDASLPAGAPLRDRLRDWVGRIIRRQPLTANPDPIILKKGAILKIDVPPESRIAPDAPLWGQVSRWNYDTSFWVHPGPGLLATRRLAEGTQAVQVAQFSANGVIWFSDVTNVLTKSGEASELSLQLKRGPTVRGRLDEIVPRPVVNGRVIVTVWPPTISAEKDPPHWHSWTPVREDGAFEFASLPPGNLEIAAICLGYINTNGSGRFNMHYPQKHIIDSDDLNIVIGMQPTVRLEVAVVDEKGKPVPGAGVSAWPNLRWGEWAAVVLGTDLYDVGDWMRGLKQPGERNEPAYHDFDGKTDERGIAILPNLPSDVREISVDHEKYWLPAISQGGRDERVATITLLDKATNSLKVTVEPKDRAKSARR